MELPLPLAIDPSSPTLGADIASLPESRAVYLVILPNATAPHIAHSLNLRRRLSRLLIPSYTAHGHTLARYFQRANSVFCWPAASRLEASLLLYLVTRRHFPTAYLKRLRLRFPWFLALDTTNPFPRLETLNRPRSRHATSYGPFLTRDLAQTHQQELEGLFQIRRCTETLAPSPSHPGCIYGEMNQCLRPCQCAVSPDEYLHEVARVAEFLSTNGKSAAALLSTARERASADLDFEQAAQLHKRLEKVAAASARRDPVVAPLTQFHGLALTRGLAPHEVRLFPMLHARWRNPVSLSFSPTDPTPRSLDRELRERLAAVLDPASAGPQPTPALEDLALFSRWYYSSWRDGHWFPFANPGDLNYRRLVREISNLSRSC